MFNHIGMFAIAGELTALSLFMGGVPQRFPTLRFAFQEGGVAWAAALLANLVGHWEKRNRDAMEHYNPAHLDRAQVAELFEEYGSKRYRERLDQLDDGLRMLSLPDEDPGDARRVRPVRDRRASTTSATCSPPHTTSGAKPTTP